MFAIGPAGSGKTYTSIALAVKALKENLLKRLYSVVRPLKLVRNWDSCRVT